VRVVFDAKTGPAVAASIVDVGNHFRMIVNEVNAILGAPVTAVNSDAQHGR
jgi:L-arabinose isomerase